MARVTLYPCILCEALLAVRVLCIDCAFVAATDPLTGLQSSHPGTRRQYAIGKPLN